MLRIQNILVILHVVMLMCLSVLPSISSAQDKLELGLFLGGAYYMGDLNPSQHFMKLRPSVGVLGRYAITDRLAAKLNITAARIAGEYPSGGNIYLHHEGVTSSTVTPEGEVLTTTDGEYEFKRTLLDVGLTGEFNFMSYDHMFFKEKSKFTPYLTLGLAATCYKSYKEKSDGEQRFVLSLPFGIGAKYKINKWMRVGMEWTMRKTFCDDLDLVDGEVGKVDPSDPYGFNEKVMTHNNDWYSLIGLTVTFSMLPRKLECNDGTKNFNK